MNKKLMILVHYVNFNGMTKTETENYRQKYINDNFVEDNYYEVKNILLESDHNDVKCIYPSETVKINMINNKPEQNNNYKYKKPYNSSYDRSEGNTY